MAAINYIEQCRLKLHMGNYDSDEDDLPFVQRVICYYGFLKRIKRDKLSLNQVVKPPPQNVRTPARKLVIHLPGVKGVAKMLPHHYSHGMCYIFSNDIIYKIVACTNKYIEVKKKNFRGEEMLVKQVLKKQEPKSVFCIFVEV